MSIGTVSGGVRAQTAAVLLAGIATFGSAAPLLAAPPLVVEVTPITGTTATLFPAAQIGNLDAGDLVAGVSLQDPDGDGIFFAEAHVGFLWSPAGGAVPFQIPDTLFNQRNRQFPVEISSGGVVVGSHIVLDRFLVLPFAWHPDGGFSVLDLPGRPTQTGAQASPSDPWAGSAAAVSDDGSTAVGRIQQGPVFGTPTKAARWSLAQVDSRLRTRLVVLPASETFAGASDVSADGSIVVGEAGADAASMQAARWADGDRAPMEEVGATSTARFVAADGSAAIGLSTTGSTTSLVRWDASGAAQVIAPPAGASFAAIKAIDPAATAAVGSISVGGNRAPFVWTDAGGLIVLGELGREADYDLSEAQDVSDDGNVVVGMFLSSVTSNGDPRPLAFIWVRGEGTFVFEDLLAQGGFVPFAFSAPALSGDGTRALVLGAPSATNRDAGGSIVRITR